MIYILYNDARCHPRLRRRKVHVRALLQKDLEKEVWINLSFQGIDYILQKQEKKAQQFLL